MDTTEWIKREEAIKYFVYAQDDLNLHILRMFEDTFSLDVAHCYEQHQS